MIKTLFRFKAGNGSGASITILILFVLLGLTYKNTLAQHIGSYQKIEAPDIEEEDNFGFSVAMNEQFLIVGTGHKKLIRNKDTLKSVGAVYSYVKKKGKWEFLQKIIPPIPQPFDFFGESVAIEGNQLFIGAKGYDGGKHPKGHGIRNGAVFRYTLNAKSQWELKEKITAPFRHSRQSFGSTFSAWENYLCIKGFGPVHKDLKKVMGQVYVYELSNDSSKLIQVISEPYDDSKGNFGKEMAMTDSLLCISKNEGLRGNQPQGSVDLYRLDSNGKWRLNQRLAPSVTTNYRSFGESLCLTQQHLFLTAYQSSTQRLHAKKGEVRIYEIGKNKQAQFNQSLKPNDTLSYNWFGNALSAQGNTLLVGAMGQGDVNTVQDSKGGITLPYVGSAYLFQQNTGGTFELKQRIGSPNPQQWSKFGFSVSQNSGEVVIGSRLENNVSTSGSSLKRSGAVYAFPKE